MVKIRKNLFDHTDDATMAPDDASPLRVYLGLHPSSSDILLGCYGFYLSMITSLGRKEYLCLCHPVTERMVLLEMMHICVQHHVTDLKAILC
jgi:hypothetical protein